MTVRVEIPRYAPPVLFGGGGESHATVLRAAAHPRKSGPDMEGFDERCSTLEHTRPFRFGSTLTSNSSMRGTSHEIKIAIPQKAASHCKTLRNFRAKTPKKDFLIAAIGASAGGMQAFAELMRSLPADTGMAFVLIQHLDPKHHSVLAEILSRETDMKVAEVSEGMTVEPNHVYVIPPNTSMTINGAALHLSPRSESPAPHMTADHFMRSLAEARGNCAVGVILSGTGSDGTLGMLEIQAHGGITFAQNESTAKYDGMPRSAIAAGSVDYVLAPKDIAHELARIARHPYIFRGRVADGAELVPARQFCSQRHLQHAAAQ